MRKIIRRSGFIVLIVLILCVGGLAWHVYQDVRQERLDRALIAAIKRPKSAEVLSLLAQGADPNSREMGGQPLTFVQSLKDLLTRMSGHKLPRAEEGPSALTLAVVANRADVVNALLSHGARGVNTHHIVVAALTEELETTMPLPLLTIAAMNGNPNIVKALLDKGADIRVRDKNGRIALLWAIELIPNDYVETAQQKPSGEAAGYSVVVKLLLDRWADVNARGPNEKTGLMYAAEAGYPNVAAFLLAHGAPINAKDEEGNTALNSAVDLGTTKAVALLLDRGANYRIKNDYGSTPLSLTLRAESPADDEANRINRKLILTQMAKDRLRDHAHVLDVLKN